MSLVQLQCYQQSQNKLTQKNFISNTDKILAQKIHTICTFFPVLNSLYNIPVSLADTYIPQAEKGEGFQWDISILGQQEKCNVQGGSCCFLGVEYAWFYFYMCFNTVCSHALSFLCLPINQSSVTSTADFTWLQSHKHVVTTVICCDCVLWLY